MALCKGEAAGHMEEGLAPARVRMYCGLGTLADPSLSWVMLTITPISEPQFPHFKNWDKVPLHPPEGQHRRQSLQCYNPCVTMGSLGLP